jgi:hypothetical protein
MQRRRIAHQHRFAISDMSGMMFSAAVAQIELLGQNRHAAFFVQEILRALWAARTKSVSCPSHHDSSCSRPPPSRAAVDIAIKIEPRMGQSR